MAISKHHIIFLFIGCTWLAVANAKGPSSHFEFSKYLSTSSSSFSQSTICSEVLNTTSGSISYKETEAFGPNERCVWVIRAWNSSSYSFAVFQMGFPNASNDHQITVTGIRNNQLAKSIVPTGPGIYNMDDVSVLIVTFNTGPSNNTENHTGFVLQFLGISDSPQLVSQRSTDNIVWTGSMNRIMYPYPGNYSNNELSTFVFRPYNVVYDPNVTREGFVYWQSGLSLEGGPCNDKVLIYFFDATKSPAEWVHAHTLCQADEMKFIIHKDLVLAVLETDGAGTAYGINFINPSNCL